MAYSPSPQPAALGGMGNYSHQTLTSVTPPPPHQALSKRDKKRNTLSQRLHDISANFAQNRDSHYRAQLHSLQLAMNFINNSEPYNDRPLNDNPNDIFEQLSAAVTDNAQRDAQAAARLNMLEVPAGTEKWAATYVQEINNHLETRDATLAAIAGRYNDAIAVIERDAEYQVDVARIEHEQLTSMIRDRIYHVVSKRKAKLLAEKDTLDIADTNAVLFHPNQFSIAHPASPGGPQSNRKTRHTRHRLEVDEMGTVGESNKRKRKAADHTENGSPARAVDSDTNYPWKESNTKVEAQQLAPLLTLDRLFNEKEIIMSLQNASRSAIQKMSKRRKLKANQASKLARARVGFKGKGIDVQQTASSSEDSESEAEPSDVPLHPQPDTLSNGDIRLEAPAMDRTASSSYHATRSTGVVPSASISTFAKDLAMPGDIVGRRSAIDYLGTQREGRKREDEYQRAPPLTEAEKDKDREAMQRAMEDMERGRKTKRSQILLSNAVRDPVDHMKIAEELAQESSLRETLREGSV